MHMLGSEEDLMLCTRAYQSRPRQVMFVASSSGIGRDLWNYLCEAAFRA